MNSINRLLQKQISKPQTYQRLKSNPFPYLNDCNRLQIFQFIYQLQQQHQTLTTQIQNKYPGKTIDQIMEKHQKMRIRREMKAIQKISIQKMEIEVGSNMSELESLARNNKNLQQESKMLQIQIQKAQSYTLELETRRRQKELMKMLAEGKKSTVNCSQIFKQLYGDVKNILQGSL